MEPAVSPAPVLEALPRSPYVTAPQCFPEIFCEQECEAILALGRDQLKYRSAQQRPVEGRRSALSVWIDPDDANRFVLDRLWTFVQKVNRFYGFELTGFRDPFLLCQYQPGDGFDWHIDVAEEATSTRKLSLSVQLSK